jgi:hypothetical protein
VVRPGRLRNEVIGRPPVEHHTGEPGTVVSIAAGDVHRQSNLGAEPTRWVGVELARPGQAFTFDGWPETVNRGGTRAWAPAQVPWRAAGVAPASVTLWSDAASGEHGVLTKLDAGQRSGRTRRASASCR